MNVKILLYYIIFIVFLYKNNNLHIYYIMLELKSKKNKKE